MIHSAWKITQTEEGTITKPNTWVVNTTNRRKRGNSSCILDIPLNKTLSLNLAMMVMGKETT